MDFVGGLATLFLMTLFLVRRHKRRHRPITLEEIRYWASRENFKTTLCSSYPQPFDPSRCLILRGKMLSCRYSFRKDPRSRSAGDGIVETIRVCVEGCSGDLYATFEDGRLIIWKCGPGADFRSPDREKDCHKTWILEGLLTTFQDAVGTMARAVER